MKNLTAIALAAVLTAGVLTACSPQNAAAVSQAPAPQPAAPASSVQMLQPGQSAPASGEISGDEALAIALDNASVPEADAYNVKVERDGDNGIPIWDIEFETEYGDYDFEVAISGGRIVGADYEVDEEWLDRLSRHGGGPLSAGQARSTATAASVTRGKPTATTSSMNLSSTPPPASSTTGTPTCAGDPL